MSSGSLSAWRDRLRRSGLAPIAVQLAVPVALGILIGGVLAYQAGSSNNAVQPVPLGAVPTPTPVFGKPSATAPATTTTTRAVGMATQTATAATNTTATSNCGIVVLANPPSVPRLATLYRLTGEMTPGCR